MERGVVRNLLGRLNARSPGDIIRIAERLQVPLTDSDTRRQVGALYRAMTDIRTARTFYAHLTPELASLVRALAIAESGLRTLPEIADLIDHPDNATRDAAVWLFHAGVLAREGDRQELPVGAIPRLFLPRELEQVFSRVVDEIDLGDMRRESLRTLVATLDNGDIEDAARAWGLRVIPGLRSRDQLSEELLRLIDEPERINRVLASLPADGTALWRAVRDAPEADGGMPWRDALAAAGLLTGEASVPDNAREAGHIRQTLREVEERLLVWHSYDDAGNRWLFVPHEIRHPGMRPRNLSLAPLTAVAADEVMPDPACHPHAVAWDLLTLLRELTGHRAPVWQPGEPLARGWQRQLNPTLWFAGEQTPPEGYPGFLLALAFRLGLIEPGDNQAHSGKDSGAFRPRVSDAIRSWRSRPFSVQTAELRSAWREHDIWIEGRERDEIEVWGAAWPDVRQRLLEAIVSLDPGAWYPRRELAHHLAQQHPGLLGSTFTVASARENAGDSRDERVARVAQVIATELETALAWFGLVESGTAGAGTQRISTVRITGAGRVAAERAGVVPDDDAGLPGEPPVPDDSPVLTVNEAGMVELLKPAPVHVWSLSAFSDQVRLAPSARYQLSGPSLGRALGAGFDLDQVITYLERQSGAPVPALVMSNLREWTAGYRRVRLRRMVVVQPDDPDALDELGAMLEQEGFGLADPLPDGTGLRVYLPETAEDAAAAEEALQRALRGGGFSGQWPRVESSRRASPPKA